MLTNNPIDEYLNPDLIPLQLKEIPNWVNWTIEERDGKPTKVPLNPDDRAGSIFLALLRNESFMILMYGANKIDPDIDIFHQLSEEQLSLSFWDGLRWVGLLI
jgi:hypothetical protein